jgi:hypothetical protein
MRTTPPDAEAELATGTVVITELRELRAQLDRVEAELAALRVGKPATCSGDEAGRSL